MSCWFTRVFFIWEEAGGGSGASAGSAAGEAVSVVRTKAARAQAGPLTAGAGDWGFVGQSGCHPAELVVQTCGLPLPAHRAHSGVLGEPPWSADKGL